MPTDYDARDTPTDMAEAKPPGGSQTGLGDPGIRSMQGGETASSALQGELREGDALCGAAEAGSDQVALDYQDSIYDQSRWRYQTRSPHEDYQAYKDIKTAEKQHELGQQAHTATSLPDAIDTTLAARGEARNSGETPEDQYMLERYGPTPFTQDVYPTEDGE
jgi:hypothetical protein